MQCYFYSLESSIVDQLQTDNYFNFQGLTGNPGVQGPEGKLGPLVSNLNQRPQPLIFFNRCVTFLRLLFLIVWMLIVFICLKGPVPWKQIVRICVTSN